MGGQHLWWKGCLTMVRTGSKTWQRSTWPCPVDDVEKKAIVTACEAFVRDVLKPRFLPEIRPTEWNYPVDIRGEWRGGRYRFIQRYRSGMVDNLGEEFDAPSPVSTGWGQTASTSIG